MAKSSVVRARNSVQAKIVVEPRDLTFRGPSTANRGLGIFGGEITPTPKGTQTDSSVPRTKSFNVYHIDINDELEPSIEEFRVAYTRFMGFREKFLNSDFELSVKTYFNQVEEGKARLLNEHGREVPSSAVAELVKGMQAFNLGSCVRVQVVLNRHSDRPFRRANETKTGDFSRTDKSATFWLPKMPSDSEINEMIDFLKSWDQQPATQPDGGRPDTPVYAERVTRNGNSFVRLFTSVSGRIEGQSNELGSSQPRDGSGRFANRPPRRPAATRT
jgi:hypothetical protein